MTTLLTHGGIYEQVRLTDSSEYIRLLQIKGSLAELFSDTIECTLSSHHLTKAPPYRCLSYVWGVTTHNSNIVVNGDFRVSVTKNLRGFLERMRAGSKDPNGYLWIDAICINQQDEVERGAQVSIMGAIYAEATQVIAWLGWEWDRLGDGSDEEKSKAAETLYSDLKPPAPLVPIGFKKDADGNAEAGEPVADNTEAHGADHAVQDQDGNDVNEEAAPTREAPAVQPEDPTEAAIDFIKVLYPAFKHWIDQGNNPWTTNFSRHAFGAPEMFEMLDIPRIGTQRWAALARFLDRKWFQRAWIVQEAALAKSLVIVCGLQVLLWDQIVKVCVFLQASGWFQRLMDFLDPSEYAVGPGWRGIVFASMQDICRMEDVKPELGSILPSPLRGSDPREDPIENLEHEMLLFFLTTTRPFDAKDSRDKVYAPLALLKQTIKDFAGGPEIQLEVEYEGKTATQVYTEAAALVLEKARTLLILSHVEVRTETSVGQLPSWVPDFSERGHAGLLDIPGVTYNALPGTESDCRYDQNTNRIELKGFQFDEIESFGPDFEEELFENKDWRPWIEYCVTAAPQHLEINGESYIDSLWRTLIGNLDGTAYPAPPSTAPSFKRYIQISTIMYLAKEHHFYQNPYTDWSAWSCLDELRDIDIRHETAIPSVQELQEFAEEWRSIYTDELAWRAANPGVISTNTRQFELKTMSAPAETYGLAFGRFYPNRRFFRSKRGYVGLAPISAMEGDQIWFLSGGKTPFVLRPNATPGENVYSLVGECYVHGFMDGEILGKVGKIEFERIALR